MEGERCENFSSANYRMKNPANFEQDLKLKLKWNKQEWINKGEEDTRLHRLCNSLHFWKNKLKPAMEEVSLILTLYNDLRNVHAELLDIITAVEGLDKDFKVKGVANFRNPRYVCLYFENKEIKDKVEEQFRIMDNSYVVYLSWALNNENNVAKLSVHWLPLTINIDLIKQKLDEYVEFIEMERRNLVFMSGREMPFARVDFKVNFKKDISAEIIPHLMDINNMEALITISGRSPLCLNCDLKGHISKYCNLRFCNTCSSLKEKNHECVLKAANKSYASKLKENTVHEEIRDPDLFDNKEVVIDKQASSKNKSALVEKIITLEKQLQEQSVDLFSELDRKEKKRKAERMSAVEGNTDIYELSSSEGASDEENNLDSSMEASEEEKSGRDTNRSIREKNINVNKNSGISKEVKERKKEETKITRKKKTKKKKTVVKDSQDDISSEAKNFGKKEDGILEPGTRSYGKPVYDNERRLRENRNFNKRKDQREFIFED